MIGMRRNRCWIVPTHPDSAIKRQRAFGKLGVPTDPHLATLRRGFQIQPTLQFVIERQILHVNRGIDDGCIERARALQGKVRPTLHGQRIKMNLTNASHVKILAAQVKSESARRRRISRASRNLGILMRQMDVVESRLPACNLEIGVEQFDRFAVDRGIRGVDMSLSLRTGPRSCNLDGHVCDARHRIFESSEGRRRRHVNMVQIHVCGVGAVVGK